MSDLTVNMAEPGEAIYYAVNFSRMVVREKREKGKWIALVGLEVIRLAPWQTVAGMFYDTRCKVVLLDSTRSHHDSIADAVEATKTNLANREVFQALIERRHFVPANRAFFDSISANAASLAFV